MQRSGIRIIRMALSPPTWHILAQADRALLDRLGDYDEESCQAQSLKWHIGGFRRGFPFWGFRFRGVYSIWGRKGVPTFWEVTLNPQPSTLNRLNPEP